MAYRSYITLLDNHPRGPFTMSIAALVVAIIACVAIIVLGGRFLLQPRQATLDFGVAAALTAAGDAVIVLTNGG